MRSTRRRQFCAMAAGLLLPISGCTGNTPDFLGDRFLSLSVGNQTPSRHTFTVTITRGNVVVYTTSLLVAPGNSKLIPDAFEVPEYGTAYEVAIGVDGEPEHTESVTIEDGDDEIAIYFKGDEWVINTWSAA